MPPNITIALLCVVIPACVGHQLATPCLENIDTTSLKPENQVLDAVDSKHRVGWRALHRLLQSRSETAYAPVRVPLGSSALFLKPSRCQPVSLSLDGPLGFTSWAVLCSYHLVMQQSRHAWSVQTAQARATWARYILEKGDYILGVQTLRNALTSASFFASACFTGLSLLVAFATKSASISLLGTIKYGTAAALLVGAALSYLQSVRYMNSVVFLFQVANDQRDETTSRGSAMLQMVLSQNCWAAGERMLYLLLPAFTWIFAGGAVMLPFTLMFLPVLYFLDLPVPANLLKDSKEEPTLQPYNYLLGRFRHLDLFGFATALRVAQETVAKSGKYAKEKYGLDSAVWPPMKTGKPL